MSTEQENIFVFVPNLIGKESRFSSLVTKVRESFLRPCTWLMMDGWEAEKMGDFSNHPPSADGSNNNNKLLVGEIDFSHFAVRRHIRSVDYRLLNKIHSVCA